MIRDPIVLYPEEHTPLKYIDKVSGSAVQLSGDAGNTLTTGSDGGLYAPPMTADNISGRLLNALILDAPGVYQYTPFSTSVKTLIVEAVGAGSNATGGSADTTNAGGGAGAFVRLLVTNAQSVKNQYLRVGTGRVLSPTDTRLFMTSPTLETAGGIRVGCGAAAPAVGAGGGAPAIIGGTLPSNITILNWTRGGQGEDAFRYYQAPVTRSGRGGASFYHKGGQAVEAGGDISKCLGYYGSGAGAITGGNSGPAGGHGLIIVWEYS